ncbi:3-ketoacyl-CoA synthase [Dionaea muscipula]
MMTLLRIPNLMFMTPAVILIITLVKVMLFISKKRKVYLVDFSCYKPKPSQKISKEVMLQRMRQNVPHFTDETMDFSRKMLERSGIGQATYVSEGLCVDPIDTRMAAARKEAEAAMFGALDRLLAKTMVDLTKIGVVVVNCGVFDPVPSLSAMVVNRYKLREDVVSYNLSGMGCSAGLVAVGLAKQLLQVHKDTYALVVSTENITQNFYQGNNRAMIIVNCAFRVGGAAILLSISHQSA